MTFLLILSYYLTYLSFCIRTIWASFRHIVCPVCEFINLQNYRSPGQLKVKIQHCYWKADWNPQRNLFEHVANFYAILKDRRLFTSRKSCFRVCLFVCLCVRDYSKTKESIFRNFVFMLVKTWPKRKKWQDFPERSGSYSGGYKKIPKLNSPSFNDFNGLNEIFF